MGLEFKLKSVELCVKMGGGLHRKFNHKNEPYCGLSLLNRDAKFCEYLGDLVVVRKDLGDGYYYFVSARRCTLKKDEKPFYDVESKK